MSYIYKIENKINHKLYIGKTNNTILERFKRHCQDSVKERNKNRPLYNAMNKYGILNFSIEQIEECSPEQASNREKYWIEHYNSFKYGYNATKGGDGVPYLDYDLIYATYLETQSAVKTAQICHCCQDAVLNIVSNINPTLDKMLLKNGKKVAQVNKETNEIINVFPSCREAGRSIGKSDQHIQEVCSGKRKSAYGYFWKYI